MADRRPKSLAAQVVSREADVPSHVQEAMDAVKARVEETAERAELCRRAHPRLAAVASSMGLKGDAHREWVRRNGGLDDEGHAAQMAVLYAYRFEEVDGEVIEVRCDGPSHKVRLVHRPDLYPSGVADPFSALASYEVRLAAARAAEAKAEEG